MRIRTIKPEFFTHEALFEAERESGLPLRVAFVGLWCAADREGRFRWEPRRLGVQILPYDGADFSRVLDALATRGFVLKYASATGVFGLIPSFTSHQIVNNREAESKIPAPSEKDLESLSLSRVGHASATREAREGHACKGEGKGREGNMEGKGTEGEGASRGRFAPPTREELDLEAAKLALPPVEVDKFVAYYGANGWRVGKVPMKSWPHALAGWSARWREREATPRNGHHHTPRPKTPDDAGF